MWITDKYGHPINSHWLISLFVQPDEGTGYEVRANTYSPTAGAGQTTASFNNGGTMTQTEADGLLASLAALLGSHNPAA